LNWNLISTFLYGLLPVGNRLRAFASVSSDLAEDYTLTFHAMEDYGALLS